MPEQRQTRAQARAAEELSFQVKREEQQSVRQAQQRASARQRREAADVSRLLDIRDTDINTAIDTAAAAIATVISDAALADELPPLEEAKDREEGGLTALTMTTETLTAAMTVEPILSMPSLDAPAPLDAGVKQEKRELQAAAKDEADGGVSEQQGAVSGDGGVKAEGGAQKEEEQKQGESAAGGRYSLRRRQPAVSAQSQRRSRRARTAAQPQREDDSDEESEFAASGGDDSDDDDGDYEDDEGDDDDEDDSEYDDDAGDSRDAAIVIGSELDDEQLSEDVSLMQLQSASSPPVALSNAEADLLFSSTDPAAFIAPFLSFSPPASLSYDSRYCLTLAVSSRSRCRQCRELIHTGYPRIGQHARIRCHLITRWYHPSCAVLAFAPTLGSLDRQRREEMVDGRQGRLDSVGQYEELLQLLNVKDAKRWKTTMESLQRRRQEIEDWHRGGGVKEERKPRRRKRRKNKKRKTKSRSEEEEEEQKEAEEPQEEEQKVAREPAVKAEARVKREQRGAVAVKREGQTKQEDGVKTERGVRVKRERPTAVKKEEKKEEEEEEKEEEKSEDAAADGDSRRSSRRRQH